MSHGFQRAQQREYSSQSRMVTFAQCAFRRLLRLLQDFNSTHPDPWYAIAKLPVHESGWDMRSPTLAILTIKGVPARLFTVGPVTAVWFGTGETDDTRSSGITIKLMRAQDRAALGGMHNRARWGAREEAPRSLANFTAFPLSEQDQVRALAGLY